MLFNPWRDVGNFDDVEPGHDGIEAAGARHQFHPSPARQLHQLSKWDAMAGNSRQYLRRKGTSLGNHRHEVRVSEALALRYARS